MDILVFVIMVGAAIGMTFGSEGSTGPLSSELTAPGDPPPVDMLAFEAESQEPSGRFTTATEVKQILPHTKGQWIAVRPYDGSDLLYFTNLLAWRCGLHQFRYGVNGGEMQVFEMEPCYLDEGAPNAIKTDRPYVSFPLDFIQTIELELLYDDLSEESAAYDRASVQIN